jgi:hypothetical protein
LKPYTSRWPPEVRRVTQSRIVEEVASWDERAGAAASPSSSYEQEVDGTDPRPLTSAGGDEPEIVSASVPVGTELPQPVFGGVVAETEDGVCREIDDGFKS